MAGWEGEIAPGRSWYKDYKPALVSAVAAAAALLTQSSRVFIPQSRRGELFCFKIHAALLLLIFMVFFIPPVCGQGLLTPPWKIKNPEVLKKKKRRSFKLNRRPRFRILRTAFNISLPSLHLRRDHDVPPPPHTCSLYFIYMKSKLKCLMCQNPMSIS